MTPHRIAAAMAIAAGLVVGCTGGQDGDDPSDAGPWTDVAEMDLVLAGDITHDGELRSTTESLAMFESVEQARSSWAAGLIGPPRLRLEDHRTRVTLAWGTGAQPSIGVSDVSVTLIVDEFLFVPRSGDCDITLEPAERFVIRGSIACSGLSGVRGGTTERPTIDDLRADLTYRIPVCVTPPDSVAASCRRIEP